MKYQNKCTVIFIHILNYRLFQQIGLSLCNNLIYFAIDLLNQHHQYYEIEKIRSIIQEQSGSWSSNRFFKEQLLYQGPAAVELCARIRNLCTMIKAPNSDLRAKYSCGIASKMYLL